MKATLNDLLNARGVSEPLREAVKALINRLEEAEKERDNYKAAHNEWVEKTEWVQKDINCGTVSANYLGLHRADVMASLLEAAEKERNALRARIEAMERQEPVGEVVTTLNFAYNTVGHLYTDKHLPLGTLLYAIPGAQPTPSVPYTFPGAQSETIVPDVDALGLETSVQRF